MQNLIAASAKELQALRDENTLLSRKTKQATERLAAMTQDIQASESSAEIDEVCAVLLMS